MENVVIRDAGIEDAEPIARLITQLGYPTSTEEMTARFNLLGDQPQLAMIVALSEEQVVGVLGLEYSVSFTTSAKTCRIAMMAVEEASRGSGVGGRLLTAAEQRMKAAGVKRALVTSATHRARAHRFYLERGYEITGIRMAKPLMADSKAK